MRTQSDINYLLLANNINKGYKNKYSNTRFTLLLENMVLSQGHLFDTYDDLLAEEIWAIQLDKFTDKVLANIGSLYNIMDIYELSNYCGWLRFYISDKMMPSKTPRQDKALVKVKMTLSQLEMICDKIIRDLNDNTKF